jgi:hypothetical protein
MTKTNSTPKYTAEFCERGVRLYREHRPDYASDTAAYKPCNGPAGTTHSGDTALSATSRRSKWRTPSMQA